MTRGRTGEPDFPESDLIVGVKARDPEAWAVLYDVHYPLLFRYAYARIHDREEAEDIAAQVFLDALKGIDRYEDRGRPLMAWLYRIAHNLIVERVRRNTRQVKAASGWVGPEYNPGPETDVETIDLLDALEKLTPDQQEVIILRYFLQLTTREVSGVIGKTEPAIFSLQTRGVASLKRILEGSGRHAPARTPYNTR